MFAAASGGGLSSQIWNPQTISSSIIQRGAEDSFLTRVCDVNFEASSLGQGFTVKFFRDLKSPTVRPVNHAQKYIAEKLPLEVSEMRADHFSYARFEVNELEMRMYRDISSFFTSRIPAATGRTVHEFWQRLAVATMIRSVHPQNQGEAAGLYKNYNLGTIEKPLKLCEKNVLQVFMKLQTVLKQHYLFKTETPFIMIDTALLGAIRTVPQFAYLMGYNQRASFMDKTLNVAPFGFEVVESSFLPVVIGSDGKITQTILAGFKSATKHFGQLTSNYFESIERTSIGHFHTGILDACKTLLPEGLALSYVDANDFNGDAACTTGK